MNTNDKNTELLDSYIEDRLTVSLDEFADPQDREKASDEAMKAIDRRNELLKIENAKQEAIRKEDAEKKKDIRNLIVTGVTLFATVVVAPAFAHVLDRRNIEFICKLEEFDTFTSTAGRVKSQGLFRKK